MLKKLILIGIVLFSLCVFQTLAQVRDEKQPGKPQPDIVNGRYGPDERNVFDLWKPRSLKPTPLVVFIHGGGFAGGRKENLPEDQLKAMLDSGFAVMAINYRLVPKARYPDIYLDGVRAIQYARYNAKDLNIDKKKIAATGGSAGAIVSLWTGFHDDLADRKNPDPVLRESSRLKAMAIFAGQSTLVPSVIAARLGDLVLQHPGAKGTLLGLFGLKAEDMNDPTSQKLFMDASPVTHLTKDDPPVWAFYSVAKKPVTAETSMGDAIHHPTFGVILKEEMDKVKVKCILRHKDEDKDIIPDMIRFLLQNLR